jgi:hypothetical protein
MKNKIQLSLSILTIAALFMLPLVAYAGSISPFVGHWQATDIDGSDNRLTIAGPPGGPFQITWKDGYMSFCNGEPGIIRGTGLLNESDANLLEADLHVECFTTGASMDAHLTLRYHPTTNTLSARYSNGKVVIWHRPGQLPPPPPTLDLRVNYGHDWVEGFYEAGHMAWITVTESDGVTVKATAQLVTEPKDFWGGETGFQTSLEDWDPAPPDIQPYDWVYGWLDNGASAQVQIGDISGMIDLEADSIEGTISALWFTDPVQVECLDWGSGNEPPFNNADGGFISANGEDPYSCAWEEWDIRLGQDVGVGYFGPDGHWVANAFFTNAQIIASANGDWLWTTGFTPWASLTISIYESKDPGAELLWEGSKTADASGFVMVEPSDHSLDLVPGNFLTVSDDVVEKRLLLETITMDVFDPDNEIMAGTAPAGRDVRVVAGMPEAETQGIIDLIADPGSDAWTANFNTIPFDITEDMRPWSFAHIYDEDGDANEANPPPPEPVVQLWVAAFTYDLPAETLTDGTYPYQFELDWEVPEPGAFSGQGGELVISSDAPIYEGCVLLRGPMELRGVHSPEGLICEEVDMINPAQPVRFLIGWLTDYAMTDAEALAHFDSIDARVVWGDGMSAELVRHEIIPFSWDDLESWFQYVCTFTRDE